MILLVYNGHSLNALLALFCTQLKRKIGANQEFFKKLLMDDNRKYGQTPTLLSVGGLNLNVAETAS